MRAVRRRFRPVGPATTMRREGNAARRWTGRFGQTRCTPEAVGNWRLFKPVGDPVNCLPHLRGRARIRESYERAAMDRIEIEARGCRDAGLVQHLLGEVETVGGEVRDVG